MNLYNCQMFLRKPAILFIATLTGFIIWGVSESNLVPGVYAQVSPAPITSSGLNTQVGAPTNLPGGKVQYDITGGNRPGNGTNLFHSFGEFGVPTNNIANFRNDSALATSNILARVTGSNPSNIFGMIKTTNFGNANLFLMNPAGILFGPNATLNVGGSVQFTTADYLRLADGVRFNAIPGPQDALLSTAPVAAFGFLASNPAGISVHGSSLSVPAGQSISLVGGNISIQAGMLENGISQASHLSAPGGQIRLASVASPGEALHPTLATGPNINGQTFTNMGRITVSGNSTINVSTDAAGTVAAGTVKIRSGQLVIDDSTISADTKNSNGAATAIDINITGDLSISNTRGVPAITARTTGSGDAGEVRISSANFEAASTFASRKPFNLIDTHTSGSGRAGNVTITTGNLQASGVSSLFNFIEAGTTGEGNGGDVTISADSVQLERLVIDTGDFLARNLFQEASGSAGNLKITADSLQMANASLVTDAFSAFADSQQAGNITIIARSVDMNGSLGNTLTATGVNRGGAIIVSADRLTMDFTTFETDTVLGPGGGITINARVVELVNASSFISTTLGDGRAGDIHVTATDHLILNGTGSSFADERPTGVFSNSTGDLGSGNAGAIVISTPRLEMTGGARINASTQSSGRGGDVIINTTDQISISGELPTHTPEEIFAVGSIQPSGVFTKTAGTSDTCSGPCGDAGRISITTGSLIMGSGSAIDSGTSTAGRGGDISINATGTINISGRLSDGTPSGIFSRTVNPATGAGGDISLNANQVSLSNGSAISARSTGSGNAGIISITAADRFVIRDSTVTTQATVADGGNITIHAGTLVQLINSSITTSVGTGAGNGGNITIDPQFVILQSGSQILANAFGGNGGNINIVAGVFLISPDSVIDASSTTGISGNINIQSPINDLSGSLAPLPSGFLKTSALLRSRCSARLAGETTSSFVLASKGGIPTEPGGTLISPLPSTNVRSARLSSSSEDMVLRVAPQFAGSSTALPPLGGTCSS